MKKSISGDIGLTTKLLEVIKHIELTDDRFFYECEEKDKQRRAKDSKTKIIITKMSRQPYQFPVVYNTPTNCPPTSQCDNNGLNALIRPSKMLNLLAINEVYCFVCKRTHRRHRWQVMVNSSILLLFTSWSIFTVCHHRKSDKLH